MSNTYTPRRSIEQWQSLVDQWQQSGQSAKQFCKEQALGYASFCQWKKRLTPSDEKTKTAEASSPESSFIDLASLGASQSRVFKNLCQTRRFVFSPVLSVA